ncbi:MAG: TIGR04255 family protein, partial [Rickettsiales bacterium]|nr:TIGR04255 family protein [Rickettsiales bacterium]
DKEKKKLSLLESDLKDFLPKFTQNLSVEGKFEGAAENFHVVDQRTRVTGFTLERVEADGNVGWQLQVVDNQIIASCMSYDRWDNVWPKIDELIITVLKKLDKKTLNVRSCTLQYVDKFTGDEKDYNIFDVFDEGAPYLTKNATEAGVLWHVYQGWFVHKNDNQRTLNVLNLAGNREGSKIITSIDHAAHEQFHRAAKTAGSFFGAKKEYAKVFLALHNNNKYVIDLLLNKKQKDAIKLNG